MNLCENEWITYMSALLVPVVSIFGLYIAWQQWKTARNKLKFELFQKRMDVYQSTRRVLDAFLASYRITPEDLSEYQKGIQMAKWVFNPELAQFLQETLWERLTGLNLNQTMTKDEDRNHPEYRTHQIQELESKRWLLEQGKILDDKFEKYMCLKH